MNKDEMIQVVKETATIVFLCAVTVLLFRI